MGSTWGKQLRISLFGESHGPSIGLVIDGLPPGEAVDITAVAAFMARRAPGRTPWSSSRREPDLPQIQSGLYQGRTTGTPLCVLIANTDQKPRDYTAQADVPRPGHADYTGQVRYLGANDPRGGGHFSGRLTAPLCCAGAIASQLLARRQVAIAARVRELGGIADADIDTANPPGAELLKLKSKEFPVLSDEKGRQMAAAVAAARQRQDSLGGIIQCFCLGLPAGLGDPIFGGAESLFASILYGIPAVKAVAFGAGFAACRRLGSENNDVFYWAGDAVRTRTNHEGGINGGITNGMPLVFDVGVKPTPSLGLDQQSVSLTAKRNAVRLGGGRHDPCIVPRAVAAVEAAAAVSLLELMLVAHGRQGFSKLRSCQ